MKINISLSLKNKKNKPFTIAFSYYSDKKHKKLTEIQLFVFSDNRDATSMVIHENN